MLSVIFERPGFTNTWFGQQNLCLFNNALSSKLTWKVLCNTLFIYEFLPALFRDKINRIHYLESSIWPFIRDIQLKIYQDFFWIIGENSQVLFWQDNWLGKPLLEIINMENNVQDSHLKVSSFINTQSGWDLPKDFKQDYPIIFKEIEKVKISFFDIKTLLWRNSISSEVSCKDVYANNFNHLVAASWEKFLWKPYVLHCCSIFCCVCFWARSLLILL